MKEEVHDKLKTIKQSFRSMMNGPASASMRDKGMAYKINWGVALPLLRQMAAEYGKDYDLAIELWKQNIRECQILATMIMPAEKMLPEVAEIWMEQTHTQELAEVAAFNLYQYLPYAPAMAYRWMAMTGAFYQIAAYHILGRLFARKMEPNELGINEFLDQVAVALRDDNLGVRHAAYNCLCRFEELGDDYAQIATKALRAQGVDLG